MRITADYCHHPKCHGCEKAYCSEHRHIFMWCQTATYVAKEPERGLWDGGECPSCKWDERIKRMRDKFDRIQETLRAAAYN